VHATSKSGLPALHLASVCLSVCLSVRIAHGTCLPSSKFRILGASLNGLWEDVGGSKRVRALGAWPRLRRCRARLGSGFKTQNLGNTALNPRLAHWSLGPGGGSAKKALQLLLLCGDAGGRAGGSGGRARGGCAGGGASGVGGNAGRGAGGAGGGAGRGVGGTGGAGGGGARRRPAALVGLHAGLREAAVASGKGACWQEGTSCLGASCFALSANACNQTVSGGHPVSRLAMRTFHTHRLLDRSLTY
jgi:hypothetical protein